VHPSAGVDEILLVRIALQNVKSKPFLHVGENAEFERQMLSGELDVGGSQGTLMKNVALHKQNSSFLHSSGYWNRSSRGKVREFNGKMHIMELAYQADFAL
jgi:3-oxoacid CoA-transferase subunit A